MESEARGSPGPRANSNHPGVGVGGVHSAGGMIAKEIIMCRVFFFKKEALSRATPVASHLEELNKTAIIAAARSNQGEGTNHCSRPLQAHIPPTLPAQIKNKGLQECTNEGDLMRYTGKYQMSV